MSPTTPRDDNVDANSDLARKKQRLSEDHDGRDSSAEGSVLIEVCEPEDTGTSLDDAIRIEDDEDTMPLYSESFALGNVEGGPSEQLERVQRDITSGGLYLDPPVLVNLANWIVHHLNVTQEASVDEWRQQYLELDSSFFVKLGRLANIMLTDPNLVDRRDLRKSNVYSAMSTFVTAMLQLSCRIIPLLPDVITASLSRRDSATQEPSRSHPVELSYYLGVAASSFLPECEMLQSLERQNLDTRNISSKLGSALSGQRVVTALSEIVKLLGGAMRLIKDAWPFLRQVMRLFGLVLYEQRYDDFPSTAFEQFMEVMRACILPAICAKHPGALPKEFHTFFLQTGRDYLSQFAMRHAHADLVYAYLRFVKSDEEAVVPEKSADEDVSLTLAEISGRDTAVLGRLFAMSWAMQTSIAYVRSDIMNVRSVGLQRLTELLQEAYSYAHRTGDLDNANTQHAVRFLRKNEVTKYIFSSESHASLVSESTVIITFLSSTGTYTDQETDVIWRACSTSVEADFVKASFGVLHQQLECLDFGHLLYILKKYINTPVESLGPHAATFLHELLQRLERHDARVCQQAQRLELAFSIIDVLKYIDSSSATPSTQSLRHSTHLAIANFASPSFSKDERREIFARILPEIGQHGSTGTTTIEVITILLQCGLPPEESEMILAMLPVTAAVDDLEHFVAGSRHQHQSSFIVNAIDLRLSFILRLLSLDQETSADEIDRRVFDVVFGEAALNEASRVAAWDKLQSLTKMDNAPPAALEMWRKYMEQHVPSMPLELTNARLIEHIFAYLHGESVAGSLSEDYTLLLQHPLWAALVRFATQSHDPMVVGPATTAISHLLLKLPAQASAQSVRDCAIECQRETVRALTSLIEGIFNELQDAPALQNEHVLLQAVNLLHTVLHDSKAFTGLYASPITHERMYLEHTEDRDNRLSFTMQIYSAGAPHPRIVYAEATKSTTVAQLLAKLSATTGASMNRVIAVGREITSLATNSLGEAGVQDASTIQVRPRYKLDFDFDHLLTSATPVEREIVARYDVLECLVDGPSNVAERVVNLLENVHPSSKARERVASGSILANELFPSARPARARFSIYVLKRHLEDCARIGLASPEYLSRGVRLLTSVLTDTTRELFEPITPKLLQCLHDFLQGKVDHGVQNIEGTGVTTLPERPATNDATHRYFDDAAAFVDRMMKLLSEIERLAQCNMDTMRLAASHAYGLLLLASQIDDAVWQRFSTSDMSAMLLGKLLLHHDQQFSEGVARPIRSLCRASDTPKAVPEVFWDTMVARLPEAIVAQQDSSTFFNLALDVLQVTEAIRIDERKARLLVVDLSALLWNYQHVESVNYMNLDNVLFGLLLLLRDAVSILKSFKQPLGLDTLSRRVAEQLLFPDDADMDWRPAIHTDTRAAAYDLLRLALESSEDFERVVDATERMMHSSVRATDKIAKFPGYQDWWRKAADCSGLDNLGMTCYMNSMLQQLFCNVQFRSFLLDVPIDMPQKQILLQRLQSLFAAMQSSIKPSQDTQLLAQALDVQIGNQEDVHDFYASLLHRLEAEMPNADCKAALSKFFTGQSITQIRGACGHVSSREEAFGDLSVTVKNKSSLHESLAEFVQGEPMEGANRYQCMSCKPDGGLLVDAVRRTCLEKVPDCLTVCLKRFTIGSKFIGEGKVNDRFAFPETLDMATYKRSYLEAPDQPHERDMFQLVGVIVHQGSLNLGHYWSYVRLPDPRQPGRGEWFCLEDNKQSYCPEGFEKIREECFGGRIYTNGNERPDNAYVLCYQRQSYVAGAHKVCEDASAIAKAPVLLPRVTLRESLAREVRSENVWRQRIAALFDPAFANHVCWLLNTYPSISKGRAAVLDSAEVASTDGTTEDSLVDTLEPGLGSLLIQYAVRVLLSDPMSDSKLSQTRSAVWTTLGYNPRIAFHVLDTFATDDVSFRTIFLNEHGKNRSLVLDLLKGCLDLLREHEHHDYMQAVQQLLSVHSGLLNDFIDQHPRLWNEYLDLPAYIARQGPDETFYVLESGYVKWILEVVAFEFDRQGNHHRLWSSIHRGTFVDFDPLCVFLFELLSEHVDLVDLESPRNNQRTKTDYGWSLTHEEIQGLTCHVNIDRHRSWRLFNLLHKRCRMTLAKGWREYGFGQLIGLLASDKAHVGLTNFIAETLRYRYGAEENELLPLLWVTLHLCANAEDRECSDLLRVLGRNLEAWTSRKESLWFMREAFGLVPCSVLDSVEQWAVPFLSMGKTLAGRRNTARWLLDLVLVEEPLSQDHAVDARRIRIARHLASTLNYRLREAYGREEPKDGWEPAMDVLHGVFTYLSTLVESVTHAVDEGANLPTEITIETNEAGTLLPRLNSLLQELDGWEAAEVALPTRSMSFGTGVRRTVEIDDSEDNFSGEDGSDEMLELEDDFSPEI